MSFADLAKSFLVKKLPRSEVELTGEIPVDVLVPFETPALKHIAEHLELPGFRHGHVPVEMARKKVGDVAVLEEAVQIFLQDFYPQLIEIQKLDVVGRPVVNITKLAPKNPVGLTIRTTVYPEVILPSDWKSVHGKIPFEPASPTTDEEVNQTIENLRQSRAKHEEGKDPVVPELNDEFAKSVGAFDTLDALKQQIKKGVGEEKERSAHEKRRGKTIDSLLDKIKVEVPTIFVESELEKIMAQLREDVTRFGLKFEDYLKQTNKTEVQVKDDFREQATKRAKLQLVLNQIAKEESIEPDKEAVEREIKHALEHFPDAKPELVRVHIETVLRNEKALKLLEGEK